MLVQTFKLHVSEKFQKEHCYNAIIYSTQGLLGAPILMYILYLLMKSVFVIKVVLEKSNNTKDCSKFGLFSRGEAQSGWNAHQSCRCLEERDRALDRSVLN